MLRMGKRKSRKTQPPAEGASRPAASRSGKTLFVYLDPELRDALDELIDQEQRSLTVEVSRAIQAHLKGYGLWPRKRSAD